MEPKTLEEALLLIEELRKRPEYVCIDQDTGENILLTGEKVGRVKLYSTFYTIKIKVAGFEYEFKSAIMTYSPDKAVEVKVVRYLDGTIKLVPIKEEEF